MLYDEMNQRPFMGGTLQIGFMWDELENAPVQLYVPCHEYRR
jgi:hypothetical protein